MLRKIILAALAAAMLVLGIALPAAAGSAHFVSASFSTSGDTVTVSAKEAGLGDLAQIHVVLSGTAACVNGGGHNPGAANKTAFTAAADEPVQNGHSDYTLSATAVFDPSSPCPGPMSVQFSDVTLADTTNGITTAP